MDRSKTQTEVDDADNNAVVTGSNNQSYTVALDDVTEGTNFDVGGYNLTPGSSTSGVVTFQIPDAVKVVKITWTTDSGYGNAASWPIR